MDGLSRLMLEALSERIRNGHEIMVWLSTVGVSVNPSSVYYRLARLECEGMVKRLRVPGGHHKQKYVYRVTEKGAATLKAQVSPLFYSNKMVLSVN